MFALPHILSIPDVSGLYVAAIDWPTVGLFLGWLVIAAFVGSVLGFLREYTSRPQTSPRISTPNVRELRADVVEFQNNHDHREAA